MIGDTDPESHVVKIYPEYQIYNGYRAASYMRSHEVPIGEKEDVDSNVD